MRGVQTPTEGDATWHLIETPTRSRSLCGKRIKDGGNPRAWTETPELDRCEACSGLLEAAP